MTDTPTPASAPEAAPSDPNKIPVGAATVVLIRDGEAGPEVLLARRNSRLFFAGGADPTQTTSSAGVFLLPGAALMVAGLGSFWRSGAIGRVIVAGFLLAPLPIVIAVPPPKGPELGETLAIVGIGT